MKAFIICIALQIASTGVMAQGSLSVTIENVRNSSGKIRVGLFATEDTFLKKAFQGEIEAAKEGSVTVRFPKVPAGEYAISVIHDENANDELDTNALGMPKEGFGFGNNAMGFFGPPSFEKSSLKIEDKNEAKQRISLKYF